MYVFLFMECSSSCFGDDTPYSVLGTEYLFTGETVV